MLRESECSSASPAVNPESLDSNLVTLSSTNDPIRSSMQRQPTTCSGLTFLSKGLHLCNLSIRHILQKLDKLRINMANEKCPGILGICETFLDDNVPDSQLTINGFDFIRKDRSDIQNKSGGGVLLYFRKSLN